MAVLHDLVIVGGGPAGLTAGLYAGRARLDVIMLDPSGGGGYLNFTESIENYPGFPDGVSGPDLAEMLIRHATKFGLKIKTEQADALVAAENPKRPLSDQRIVELLKEANIDIARRTVAKYREMLGILSSSKRKRLI